MPGLLVFGSLNVDHIVTVDALPAAGQTVLSRRYEVRPGGKGRNQAAAAAALGGPVALLGAVGDDESGGWLRRDVEARGVDVSLLATAADTASGLALITVDAGGENTIVVHPGANATVASLDGARMDPGRYPVLLASLEVPLDSVRATMEAARTLGITTVLNAAPMVGTADGRLAAILAHTDVLVVNQSEAAMMLGRPVAADDPGSLARSVAGWRTGGAPPVVVVTLGAGGTLVVADTAVAHPAFPVDAASTVGAGDTYAATLSLGLARGWSLDRSVCYALAGAAAFLAGELSAETVSALVGPAPAG